MTLVKLIEEMTAMEDRLTPEQRRGLSAGRQRMFERLTPELLAARRWRVAEQRRLSRSV